MDADWNWLSGSYVDVTYVSSNSTEYNDYGSYTEINSFSDSLKGESSVTR